MWVVVVMARVVPCTFCDEGVILPGIARTVEQIDALVTRHMELHAEEALAEMTTDCARCQRYADAEMPPSDPLHRPCFDATGCTCRCSYPEKESDLCR